MLMTFVGQEAFEEGLSSYIQNQSVFYFILNGVQVQTSAVCAKKFRENVGCFLKCCLLPPVLTTGRHRKTWPQPYRELPTNSTPPPCASQFRTYSTRGRPSRVTPSSPSSGTASTASPLSRRCVFPAAVACLPSPCFRTRIPP